MGPVTILTWDSLQENMSVCRCVCVHIWAWVLVHVCAYGHVCVRIWAWVHGCACMGMGAGACVYVWACVCILGSEWAQGGEVCRLREGFLRQPPCPGPEGGCGAAAAQEGQDVSQAQGLECLQLAG